MVVKIIFLRKSDLFSLFLMVNILGLYQNVEIRDTHTGRTRVKVIAYACSFLFPICLPASIVGF